MKTGVELIAEERKRQIEKEGWTKEHDDNPNIHVKGDLALAGACYALDAIGQHRLEWNVTEFSSSYAVMVKKPFDIRLIDRKDSRFRALSQNRFCVKKDWAIKFTNPQEGRICR